jgi:hypothetical protein
MVEVTKAPRVSLFNKITNFEKEYAPKIKEQLKMHKVPRRGNPTSEWTIGLWVFAPKANSANLEGRMQAAGVKTTKVTPLEVTMAPSAWNSRFR